MITEGPIHHTQLSTDLQTSGSKSIETEKKRSHAVLVINYSKHMTGYELGVQ